MSSGDEIVRQRQCAMRRAMDRRGIALKVVASDSGIPYPTLLTYFPEEGGRKPTMMPASAVYAMCGAVPEDILSLWLPDGMRIVRVSEALDHDELEAACREYLRLKGAAHHPASPGGREIAAVEASALCVAAAPLRAVA